MKTKFPLRALLAFIPLLAACAPKTTPAAAIATPEPTARGPVPEATLEPYAVDTADTSSIGAFVDVSDQAVDDAVTVTKVHAAVDGWVVIHIEGADDKPGPVIGYTQVPAGESSDVQVTIDASQVTQKLFAMLHVDEGSKGTYEFPGADVPIKNGEMIVMQAFNSAAEGKPSVTAIEQSIADGTVTIASASMNAPGWIVIHTDVDGKPGPVIGYALLPMGKSQDIKVEIDESQATPKLFAMLHVDAGIVGTYEFPGDDVPVKDGDTVTMIPFDIK